MNNKRRATEELVRRRAISKSATSVRDVVIGNLRAVLSPKQLALRNDKGQHVCTVCTRQSGKTSDILLDILERIAGKPAAIVYVVLPTRDRARDTLWDRWKDQVAALGATDDNHHETRLETRLPGGGVVRFVGCPDKKRADRIRGQVLDALLIDEAANFPDDVLEYLVKEAAEAALGIKEGALRIYATPGMEPAGFLYQLYTNQRFGYSRHFLTLFDNPAWRDPAAYLAKIRQTYAYAEDDPTYQREWMGHWVADSRARVYKLEEQNLVDDVGAWDYTVMAVDLGATDESAICVLGWQAGSRVLKVIHEEAEGELDITSVAERVKALQAQYGPMVTMVDGAAKQSVLELQNRHGIPLEATPKSPGYKGKAIAQVNADFRRGMVQVPRETPLVAQMRALQWDPKAVGIREKQGVPNDRCDAFLYAYLRAYHYVEHEPAEKIVEGSPQFWQLEAQRVRDEHEKAHQPKDIHDPWASNDDDSPW